MADELLIKNREVVQDVLIHRYSGRYVTDDVLTKRDVWLIMCSPKDTCLKMYSPKVMRSLLLMK